MRPPRKAMSAPARICKKRSAVAAVRVKRGSTTIIFALRRSFASIGHLKPHGWFSAGLPPMINIMSVFLMSILGGNPAAGHPGAFERGPETAHRGLVSITSHRLETVDPHDADR